MGGYTPANGFKIGAIEPQPLVDGTATPQPKLYYNGTELGHGYGYICTYEKTTALAPTRLSFSRESAITQEA